MAAIACMDVVLLFILIRTGRKEELHSFTTMNPYVQEQLLHNVPEDTAAGEFCAPEFTNVNAYKFLYVEKPPAFSPTAFFFYAFVCFSGPTLLDESFARDARLDRTVLPSAACS